MESYPVNISIKPMYKESGNGMRGMITMLGISVGMSRIRMEMMGMREIRLGMRGIGMGTKGIGARILV